MNDLAILVFGAVFVTFLFGMMKVGVRGIELVAARREFLKYMCAQYPDIAKKNLYHIPILNHYTFYGSFLLRKKYRDLGDPILTELGDAASDWGASSRNVVVGVVIGVAILLVVFLIAHYDLLR